VVVVVAATVLWPAIAGPHPPTRINSRAHRRYRRVDNVRWRRRKRVDITQLDGFDDGAGSRLLNIPLFSVENVSTPRAGTLLWCTGWERAGVGGSSE